MPVLFFFFFFFFLRILSHWAKAVWGPKHKPRYADTCVSIFCDAVCALFDQICAVKREYLANDSSDLRSGNASAIVRPTGRYLKFNVSSKYRSLTRYNTRFAKNETNLAKRDIWQVHLPRANSRCTITPGPTTVSSLLAPSRRPGLSHDTSYAANGRELCVSQLPASRNSKKENELKWQIALIIGTGRHSQTVRGSCVPAWPAESRYSDVSDDVRNVGLRHTASAHRLERRSKSNENPIDGIGKNR